MARVNAAFTGAIPALYDRYLGPLIFKPFVDGITQRLPALDAGHVLETAAGTGIVTRALLDNLPAAVAITATDLNQPMLDRGAALALSDRVRWQMADAQALPFAGHAFDAVVCQFGVSFFADKQKAYREVRRVMKPGGQFIFNVWDKLEHNELADLASQAVAEMFPDDPPQFIARTPHGYHDTHVILADLKAAGFTEVTLETVTLRSAAASSTEPAIGFCQGSPLRNEIEARDARRLAEATERAAIKIGARFGNGPVDAKLQAHVVTASG